MEQVFALLLIYKLNIWRPLTQEYRKFLVLLNMVGTIYQKLFVSFLSPPPLQ